MKIGVKAEAEVVVDRTNSALAMKSGDMAVFATPSMIALMEQAAVAALEGRLTEGTTTVGSSINVAHSKASPIGAKIVAQATLTGVEGRKLTFELTASDGKGVIGSGLHERFIVDRERFLAKL